jgi:bifunctional DNA-binding transcriptional regulator/antitoxin component of YhaV-PrlF toxin-antitoxin module
MKQEIMRDITVTWRGQITLPVAIRKSLRLGAARKIRMRLSADGDVIIHPLPDVMSYYGSLKSRIPYDHREKAKARHAITGRAAKEVR